MLSKMALVVTSLNLLCQNTEAQQVVEPVHLHSSGWEEAEHEDSHGGGEGLGLDALIPGSEQGYTTTEATTVQSEGEGGEIITTTYITTTTTEYIWRGASPEPTPPPCLGSDTRITCLFDYYSETFSDNLLVDVFGEYEGT